MLCNLNLYEVKSNYCCRHFTYYDIYICKWCNFLSITCPVVIFLTMIRIYLPYRNQIIYFSSDNNQDFYHINGKIIYLVTLLYIGFKYHELSERYSFITIQCMTLNVFIYFLGGQIPGGIGTSCTQTQHNCFYIYLLNLPTTTKHLRFLTRCTRYNIMWWSLSTTKAGHVCISEYSGISSRKTIEPSCILFNQWKMHKNVWSVQGRKKQTSVFVFLFFIERWVFIS